MDSVNEVEYERASYMLAEWYEMIHNDYSEGVEDELIATLEQHPEMLTARFPINLSLMHAAADNGKLKLMDYLLSKGVDINITLQEGEEVTPLLFALIGYYRLNVDNPNDLQLEMVEWLLDHGANIEFGGKHEASSVAAAVVSGNIKAVEFLLERGADINAAFYNVELYFLSDDEPKEAFMFNALSLAKDAEMMDYLLAHGAQEPPPLSDEYDDEEEEYDEEQLAGKKLQENIRDQELKNEIERLFGPIYQKLSNFMWDAIAPSSNRAHFTLVTNTISHDPLKKGLDRTNPEQAYAEVVIKLPAIDIRLLHQPWKVSSNVIGQIYKNPENIQEGCIFPIEGYDENETRYLTLNFWGVLVSRPTDESQRVCRLKNGDCINFYVLNFIFPEEAELARKHGVDYLQKLLRSKGIGEVMDQDRENVGLSDC